MAPPPSPCSEGSGRDQREGGAGWLCTRAPGRASAPAPASSSLELFSKKQTENFIKSHWRAPPCPLSLVPSKSERTLGSAEARGPACPLGPTSRPCLHTMRSPCGLHNPRCRLWAPPSRSTQGLRMHYGGWWRPGAPSTQAAQGLQTGSTAGPSLLTLRSGKGGGDSMAGSGGAS